MDDLKEKLKDEKLDIIVLAGQSNAEGNGKGDAVDYIPDKRILLMNDDSMPRFEKTGDKSRLVLNYPARDCVSVAEEPQNQDGKRGNLCLSFARNYAVKFLEPDRKILIVNGAVGGTGFARKEWGKHNILYVRLVNMVKKALAFNSENRISAFLWHQGECDSVENPSWDSEKRYLTHYKNLTEMLSDFKNTFGLESLPFVAGGFAEEWYLKNKTACDAVLKAVRKTCETLKGGFVGTSDLKSNNQKVGDGDDLHFCRDALFTLGERYFNAYCKIKR